MRWPPAWTDIGILRDTALEAADPAAPGDGVAVVKGEWPGIRLSRAGADADAGPTGVPWVDSNGWVARLAAARNPGKTVWIDAAPPAGRPIWPHAYLVAMADAAAFGARWIVSLDEQTAAGVARGDTRTLPAWTLITKAARFFADRQEWGSWTAQALIGVNSVFAGPNEFFSTELLNLLDRAGMHNRVLIKGRAPAEAFRGLRKVLDADRRKDEDPYVVANDAVIEVSHRYDLVRCWNTGAISSNYLIAPDQSKAVVHMIFYADRGPNSASVRVVGRWRGAKISTVDEPAPRPVKMQAQKDAVEVYLPQVSQYVALQLEA
jgi:hypothetical protein